MIITLTQKTPFTEFSSWYGREVTRVPVHWAGPDGKEHFLINRLSNPDGDKADAYVRMDAQNHVREINAFTQQLAGNDGAWIVLYNTCSLLPRERREAGAKKRRAQEWPFLWEENHSFHSFPSI